MCPEGTYTSSDPYLSKCISNYFMNGVIITSCPYDSSSDPSDKTCYCNKGYFKLGFACKLNCPVNSDAYISNTTTEATCKCKPGYYMFNDICVLECPDNAILTKGQCICTVPYAFYDGECVASCSNGMIISSQSIDGMNICICPLGTAFFNGICANCPPGAIPESFPSICKCTSGFYDGVDCTNFCPEGYIANNTSKECISDQTYNLTMSNSNFSGSTLSNISIQKTSSISDASPSGGIIKPEEPESSHEFLKSNFKSISTETILAIIFGILTVIMLILSK